MPDRTRITLQPEGKNFLVSKAGRRVQAAFYCADFPPNSTRSVKNGQESSLRARAKAIIKVILDTT
jgi:hypothetical protein